MFEQPVATTGTLALGTSAPRLAVTGDQYQSPAQLAHVRLPHYSWSAIEPILLLSDGCARIGSLLLLCGLQQLTRAPCRLLQS